MWLGDNVVCHVWSFLDDSKDIPYSIFRFGKSKKERGTGYKWECSCPSFKFRGGKTCKHLITMRQEVKDKTIQLISYPIPHLRKIKQFFQINVMLFLILE